MDTINLYLISLPIEIKLGIMFLGIIYLLILYKTSNND
jgi:flagellar biosynthesis protein FliR